MHGNKSVTIHYPCFKNGIILSNRLFRFFAVFFHTKSGTTNTRRKVLRKLTHNKTIPVVSRESDDKKKFEQCVSVSKKISFKVLSFSLTSKRSNSFLQLVKT